MSTYFIDRETEEADLVATAEAWSAYLGQTVSATDVTVLLAIGQRPITISNWQETTRLFALVKEMSHA